MKKTTKERPTKPEKKLPRVSIRRIFNRVNIGMWIEQHGYLSHFRSPSDNKPRVPLSNDELDVIENLADGARIIYGRQWLSETKGHAVYFYWSVPDNADKRLHRDVYDRTVFSLLARGVVCVRFDAADNAYIELSPAGKDAARGGTKLFTIKRGAK